MLVVEDKLRALSQIRAGREICIVGLAIGAWHDQNGGGALGHAGDENGKVR